VIKIVNPGIERENLNLRNLNRKPQSFKKKGWIIIKNWFKKN